MHQGLLVLRQDGLGLAPARLGRQPSLPVQPHHPAEHHTGDADERDYEVGAQRALRLMDG